MKAAASDLASTRSQHANDRRQMITLFSAQTIDSAKLEQLRVQQMQLADTASRRMLQAMVDAANVLTPDQRAKLAQKRLQHGPHGQAQTQTQTQ
jgi:Spy/CpxP family protein refolding chaperone